MREGTISGGEVGSARRHAGTLAMALVFLILPAAAIWAQSAAKGSDADVAAMKRTLAAFDDAFRQQDAHALGMTFAEDGDHTNMFGLRVHGRQAIGAIGALQCTVEKLGVSLLAMRCEMCAFIRPIWRSWTPKR